MIAAINAHAGPTSPCRNGPALCVPSGCVPDRCHTPSHLTSKGALSGLFALRPNSKTLLNGKGSQMKLSLITAALLSIATTGAFAHATLEQAETPQGAGYKAVVRIGHGCAGEATLKVRVQIPEGVIAVKPMPKAGWTLETVKGPYEKEYDYYGSKLKEGVKEIIWTGELLDEYYDEFVFNTRITDTFAVGSTAYFPTVQECANGAERWIEIPAEGQDPHELEGPAPGVVIVEPGHSH